MTWLKHVVVVGALAFAGACGNEPEPPKAQPAKDEAPPAATAPPADEPVPLDEEALKKEFAAEANTNITAENAAAVAAELEKELAAE